MKDGLPRVTGGKVILLTEYWKGENAHSSDLKNYAGFILFSSLEPFYGVKSAKGM